MRTWLFHTRHGRLGLVGAALAVLAGLTIWRATDLGPIADAFDAVSWGWVAAAIGMNVLSVQVRAIAWHIVLNQALPPPHPRHRHVLSAFCVGLLGNAVLPGRVGEVARVAVMTKHVPNGQAVWGSILGSIVAHRLFDVIPIVGLVIWVIVAARIPSWAHPGVEIFLAAGIGLIAAAFLLVWWQRRRAPQHGEPEGRVRRLFHMVVRGLHVLHAPGPAVGAAFFQILGWTTQVLAVYLAFKAFHIDAPIEAAGLVLLAVNVALAFPLWPGSIGLFQAATALALLPYGVSYQAGFLFGIGLQAIEASVGVGLGLVYLAREGISFAMLKQIPKVSVEDVEDELEEAEDRDRGTTGQPTRGRGAAPVSRTPAQTGGARARVQAREDRLLSR
jgi:uncharacterized membrane protein YbhN (UPF0104 family)